MKQVVDVIVRSQKSKGGNAYTFGGPDRYVVAIVRRADGEPPALHPISEANIRKYGWEVRRCGEGYSKHSGPRSALGKAIAWAEQIKREIEGDKTLEVTK